MNKLWCLILFGGLWGLNSYCFSQDDSIPESMDCLKMEMQGLVSDLNLLLKGPMIILGENKEDTLMILNNLIVVDTICFVSSFESITLPGRLAPEIELRARLKLLNAAMSTQQGKRGTILGLEKVKYNKDHASRYKCSISPIFQSNGLRWSYIDIFDSQLRVLYLQVVYYKDCRPFWGECRVGYF